MTDLSRCTARDILAALSPPHEMATVLYASLEDRHLVLTLADGHELAVSPIVLSARGWTERDVLARLWRLGRRPPVRA